MSEVRVKSLLKSAERSKFSYIKYYAGEHNPSIVFWNALVCVSAASGVLAAWGNGLGPGDVFMPTTLEPVPIHRIRSMGFDIMQHSTDQCGHTEV